MIYTHLAAALIAASAAAFGTWQIQEWRYGSKEAERLEAVARDRMRAEKNIDTAAVGHEKDKVRIETEFVTITETVERVVREPFYIAPNAPACFDADGLRQLESAVRGSAPAASQPAPALRRSDATR